MIKVIPNQVVCKNCMAKLEYDSQESMKLNTYNPLFRYLTVENSPQQVQIDLRKIL